MIIYQLRDGQLLRIHFPQLFSTLKKKENGFPEGHKPSGTTGTGLFPGGKAAGVWHCPPTQSSAEVKEKVQLYLYSLSGPSWPVLR